MNRKACQRILYAFTNLTEIDIIYSNSMSKLGTERRYHLNVHKSSSFTESTCPSTKPTFILMLRRSKQIRPIVLLLQPVSKFGLADTGSSFSGQESTQMLSRYMVVSPGQKNIRVVESSTHPAGLCSMAISFVYVAPSQINFNIIRTHDNHGLNAAR